MKSLVLSMATVLTMSSYLTAGGDIAPIIVPVNDEIVVDDSGFYIGAGLTYNLIYSVEHAWFAHANTQDETIGFTGIVGYEFNDYIGVEGRILKTFTERDYSDTTIYSIFLKPQYRFRDVERDDDDDGYLSIYGLLGFGNTYIEGSPGDESNDYSAWPENIGKEMMNETSFQWGFGLSYTFKDDVEDEDYRYKDTWTIFVDYIASIKDASVTPTRLYDYGSGEDANYYDKLSVEGLTVGLIYNF